LLPLTPEIAVASTQLQQPFHKDPADQIIVATARLLDCALATDDAQILAYPQPPALSSPLFSPTPAPILVWRNRSGADY
jgi:PIN domain nuclease of toxin-antitoxin system